MNKALVVLILITLSAAAPPNFSGRWVLAEQETSAFRRRGQVGNHEGPVTIAQTSARLTLTLESTPPLPPIEYDLTGTRLMGQSANGDPTESRSHWDGATLVTRGRRVFITPDGPKVFSFSERRQLSATRRMIVEMTINMFPQNLRRRSVYVRVD